MQNSSAIIINPKLPPKATIIWLHGLGADGHDFISIIDALNLPEKMAVRFIFPHAPIRKITMQNGCQMRGWFDVHALNLDAPEDMLGMKESLTILEQLVKNEIASGIESKNIVLAGFSQGAAVALHAALSLNYTFAGILAMSGFLLRKSLPTQINQHNEKTNIIMLHGKYDNVVPLEWAKLSYDLLTKLNFKVNLITYNIEHSVCEEEVHTIAKWLQDVLKHE